MAEGSPLKASKETDLVILMEAGEAAETNAGIRSTMLDRFSEVAEMEGRVTALSINTRVELKEGWSEIIRFIYKAETGSLQEWFEALREIRNRMEQNERKTVAVYPLAEDDRGILTRRIAEAIFRGSGKECIIYVGKRGSEAGIARQKATEAVLVRKEGKSYADLLKEVRAEIAPKTDIVKGIRTIRCSKDGNMIITVDKKQTGVMTILKSELNKITSKENIRTLKDRGEKTIIIKDMDEITTKEEVENAIIKETGIRQGEGWFGQLRPCYGRSQAITVKLPTEKAELLLRGGKIKIGLNLCLIMERLNVQQCYRCWKYGHTRDKCKGEDQSQKCRKCGIEGHRAQTCEGVLWCLNCKIEGHAASSGACPCLSYIYLYCRLFYIIFTCCYCIN